MARRDSIMTKPKDSKGALRRMVAYLGPFPKKSYRNLTVPRVF